jgi:signal transduction histidine kinase
LRGAPGEFYLTVTDAGTGFDPVKAMGSRGLGLISIRERLQLANGSMSIESAPG